MAKTANYVIKGHREGRHVVTSLLHQANPDSLPGALADFRAQNPGISFTATEVDDAGFQAWVHRARRTPSNKGVDHLTEFAPKKPLEVWPNLRVHSLRDRDGHPYITFSGVKGLPKGFSRTTWRPVDAFRATEDLVALHRSPWGFLLEENMTDSKTHLGTEGHELDPMSNTMFIADTLADPSTMVVLAHPDFTTMMLAAAASASLDFVHDSDLISPNGIVYFAEETELGTMTTTPARAISWMTVETLTGRFLLVRVLTEGRHLLAHLKASFQPAGEGENEATLGAIEAQRLLTPVEYAECKYADGPVDPDAYQPSESFSRLVGLVVAISAIARSAQTRSEDADPAPAHGRKRKKRSARHQGLPERPVRVLSLVRPEYAEYERQASEQDLGSVEVEHRGVRVHWVRGHWRDQWYPSLQDHRRIWIDGFVKGDPHKGVVSGRAVYSARLPAGGQGRA